MVALSGLKEKLLEIHAYLLNILDNKLPVNNQIIYNLQTIFNLLPNLNVQDLLKYVQGKEKGGRKKRGEEGGKGRGMVFRVMEKGRSEESASLLWSLMWCLCSVVCCSRGLMVKTNDMHFIVYLSGTSHLILP